MTLIRLLPIVTESWLSILLYFFLLYIVVISAFQFYSIKIRTNKNSQGYWYRSLVPLGCSAAVFGLIGSVRKYVIAFDAIEQAGDISPSIVAAGFGSGGSYFILGLLNLAIAFFFKYLNQK